MVRVKSEDVIGTKGRPFTGAEYLESVIDIPIAEIRGAKRNEPRNGR